MPRGVFKVPPSSWFKPTHGMSRKPGLFRLWMNIIQRCRDPNHKSFHHYGGRGISVCEQWQGKTGFQQFVADMGQRPPKTQVDRIDNEKGYSPENCRWASPSDNCNNRRNNYRITAFGETLTLSQWSRKIGIRRDTLERRIKKYRWPIEKALSTPVAS